MLTVRVVLVCLCLCREGAPRAARVPLRQHLDVETTQGWVRGYRYSRPPHFAYLGLPYGRPPTRHNRFKPAKPPRRWDGIYEATHRIRCPQPNGDGTENCLVLNIFTPVNATSLPVLVHVHGGGFQSGWGSFQPSTRLLREGIVVVTINYRLGALGFFCLGTPDAPGNAGLKDQIAALYWIHRNIASFGGNPNEVTVYGTGSGAASVELLLLSGMAKGLLHRAILESGSAISPASMSYDPLLNAFDVMKEFGFNTTESRIRDLTKFYKSISAKQILNTSRLFLPCVDNNMFSTNGLIDKDPMFLLQDGNFQRVPIMMTFTNTEGIALVGENLYNFMEIPENFDKLLPNNLYFRDDKTKHKIGEIVKDFYLGQDIHYESVNIVQGFVDYISDIFTEYPIVKSATLHATKGAPHVFLMEFPYKGSFSTSENLSNSLDTDHIDIYNLLFSKNDLNDNVEYVADTLVLLWSNFIRFSDPTPLTNAITPVVWQPVQQDIDPMDKIDIDNVPCLLFTRKLTITIPQSSHRLAFWDTIYSKFYRVRKLSNANSDHSGESNVNRESYSESSEMVGL